MMGILTLSEYQQQLADGAKKRYPDTNGHSCSNAPCVMCGDLDGCWVWCKHCNCGHSQGCCCDGVPIHDFEPRKTGPHSLATPYATNPAVIPPIT